ncbi:MAG: GntR family transcriptional regulator [Myxococcota bacterium]
MTRLNPESPIPLYHQLADVLLERIRGGEYALGSQIPSEPELARHFGIGRPTVRQATDQLIRKRCLERRRGSGTFVTEPPEQVDLFTLAGTMASFEKRGIGVKTTLVQRPKRMQVGVSQGEEVARENPFVGREAYFLSRLSRVRSKPVLFEEIHLDPETFPGLERMALAGRSLSELVESQFQMRATSADQSFRVHSPRAECAALLGITDDQPILLVQRSLHFGLVRDAIFASLYCRTDQLVFSQTLSQNGEGI